MLATVAAYGNPCRATDPTPPPVDPVPAPAGPPQQKIVTRTTQRYAQVQDLRAQGESISAISRSLHPDIQTVRRFAHASSLDELLAKTVERASVLDGFTAYCTSAGTRLHRRRRADQGAQSAGMRAATRPYAATCDRFAVGGHPATRPTPPTVREVAGWIMRRLRRWSPRSRSGCSQILAGCPQLDPASAHVAAFAEIMANLRGNQLQSWIAAVEADDLPGLRSLPPGCDATTKR